MTRLSDGCSPVVYIQESKHKSGDVLRAFAEGCDARIASTSALELAPGVPVWYGVRPGWAHLWAQAKRECRDTLYLDNAFFDAGREHYFRVGVNALQSWSRQPSDGKRLAALGVQVQPWRRTGSHILIAPQSVEFMTMHGREGWLGRVVKAVQAQTDRPIVLRSKGSNRPLAADLRDAWLVVGHSSAILNEALLAGLPIVTTDPKCAASEFSSTFESIESPRYPDGRGAWAARLCDSMWTLDEMKRGMAWRAVREW